MSYIYKITNDINNNIYIAKTEFDIQKRFQEHIQESKKGFYNRPLYNAMNKYGIEHFKIELVEKTDSPEEREKYYIQRYDSYNNGYNATLGGDGKKYIDYDRIIEYFQAGLNITEIAKESGYDIGHISNILKEEGITKEQINKQSIKNKIKKVYMIDKKTNQILKEFQSVAEASQFCIDNALSNDKISGISAHISQACNGIRKTAYKYK